MMTVTSICEHFGFLSIPFLKPPRLPFCHAAFSQNLDMISTAFYTRLIASVIGPSGSGKTALLTYAAARLDPSSHRVVSCELSDPKRKALYKFLAIKCGINAAFYADDIKLELIDFFENENRQGKTNCVIVDEAHSLSIPTLEELRSFYEEAGNFSLVLVGLPSLFSDTLDLAVNLPMKRRISLVINTEGITLAETRDYIAHHLEAVRAKNQVFDEKCFPVVHSLTKGMPGKIDQLCYASLMEAFKNKTAIVTEQDIKDCAQRINY